MCVLTHSVDPSVFHFLAALWFIQSWGAEVTQWLAAFAKKGLFSSLRLQPRLDLLEFSTVCSVVWCSRTDGYVFAWVSVCVTKELAQSGDTRHEAVEGHVQLARSEALGEQLHYLAVALHPCWKRKCGGRFACVYFSRCQCACVCAQYKYRRPPALSWARRGSWPQRSPRQIGKRWTEREKLHFWVLCHLLFTHIHDNCVPADCVSLTAGSQLACDWGWRVLWTSSTVKDLF